LFILKKDLLSTINSERNYRTEERVEMKNWKFLLMSLTMVGVLFLAACGNADEDTSNTGDMNEEKMSDDMEKEENGDMSNEEEMEDMNEIKENDNMESEEDMKEKSDMEGNDMMEKDEKMEDGMESEETKEGM
jgi:hypothetical protein